jgi:hypothetical protein
VTFTTVAALLEEEHDLLSVLLVRAERLSDGKARGIEAAIRVAREELSALELARAVAVSELGLGDMPTLAAVIAAAPGHAGATLATLQEELRLLTFELDQAGRAAGLTGLVPVSLRDFLATRSAD